MLPLISVQGSHSVLGPPLADVRITAESGGIADIGEGLKSAMCRHVQNADGHWAAVYSSRVSARNKNASGIVRRIAFAVFRLTASSNFVGCSIGKPTSLMLHCGLVRPMSNNHDQANHQRGYRAARRRGF